MTHHLHEQPTPANSSARASLGTMKRLFDAFLDVSTGLDLDETLRHIVQAGVELIGAQYGTLGVLDPDGVMVTLVHVGPDPEQPPEPRTLRSAPELSTDLARETVSFLSVPVSSRGKALGTLYLTARRDMLFSAEDDGVLTALAAAAGIAIVNARLYEAAEASRIWLAAVTDVLTALLQGRSLQDVLDLEVNRVAVLTGGRRDLPGARPDRP